MLIILLILFMLHIPVSLALTFIAFLTFDALAGLETYLKTN